ncbi:hypothetical protein, partial [Brevibacterium casei]|uniref:hypothetical protein n=1 Tax=Brevibacterium casei TaxID=33889 RepID=UPI001C92E2F4
GRRWWALGGVGVEEDGVAGEVTVGDWVDVVVDRVRGEGSGGWVRRVGDGLKGGVCGVEREGGGYVVGGGGGGEVGVEGRFAGEVEEICGGDGG